MVNEELLQRGYIQNGELKGEPYGLFELFSLGSTTINELYRVQLIKKIPENVDYPFSVYKHQGSLGSVKPDKLFVRRTESNLSQKAGRPRLFRAGMEAVNFPY